MFYAQPTFAVILGQKIKKRKKGKGENKDWMKQQHAIKQIKTKKQKQENHTPVFHSPSPPVCWKLTFESGKNTNREFCHFVPSCTQLVPKPADIFEKVCVAVAYNDTLHFPTLLYYTLCFGHWHSLVFPSRDNMGMNPVGKCSFYTRAPILSLLQIVKVSRYFTEAFLVH